MRSSIFALSVALLCAGGAKAASTPYDASFFASYRPQTALDMVAHTPGFILKAGNDRRGFAGALGNVLIDGRHPIVKDQSLEDVLKTIPVAQVLRIEVESGDTVAGDPSGESVLVNVVRVSSTGSGYASAGTELANRGRPVPNGLLSWTGRSGVADYSLGLQSYSLDRNQRTRYRTADASGGLISTGREPSRRRYYEFKLNGQMSLPLLGGQLSLSGQGLYSRYHEDTLRDDYSPGGPFIGGQSTPYTETTASYSASAEYVRDLGPWQLDATGFASRKHFFSGVLAQPLDASATPLSTTRQTLDRHSGETIGRAVFARTFGQGRLEIGGEFARNTMDATLELTYAAGGQIFAISVPDSNALIVEDRTEFHLSYVRDLVPNLGLELRLTREQSDLHFRGDTNQDARYAFIKPSLILTRRFDGDNQVVLHVYRDADQIDFGDFLSAESLGDSLLNGGNPNLRPQTSWRTEISGDWHFGPRTAVSGKLYHYALNDTADLAPVSKGGITYMAPGNIGRGRIDGATIGLSLPLDSMIRGGSLTLNLMGQTSEVTDPITGDQRALSNLATYTASLAFRQDLPGHNLAWGIDYSDASAQPQYLLAEADLTRTSPMLDLYVERSRLGPFTARLTLNSLGNQAGLRRRAIYLPNRNGTLAQIITQTQIPGRWINFTLSRGF